MTISPDPEDSQPNPTPSDNPWGRIEPRWPLGVTDPTCPGGHEIAESRDRRLLWHLETELVVTGTTDGHRRLARRLYTYLTESCTHHWHDWSGYMDIPAIWQCLWCNSVVNEKPANVPAEVE